MQKAGWQLILCADDRGPEARRRRHDRCFRPSVIDGGKRATAVPAGDPWQAWLELFDLGLLVSRTNYLVFVAAGLAPLARPSSGGLHLGRRDHRKTALLS